MTYRNIFAAAFLAAAFALPAQAATTTMSFSPAGSVWMDLGAGPIELSVSSSDPCLIGVGDTAPSSGIPLTSDNGLTPMNVTSHVWATNPSGPSGAQCVVKTFPLSPSYIASSTGTFSLTWKSIAANTVTLLSTKIAWKYISAKNVGTGLCMIGWGGVTPSAILGDPLGPASSSPGQGGSTTFEGVFVPSGLISVFCTAPSIISLMEGN